MKIEDSIGDKNMGGGKREKKKKYSYIYTKHRVNPVSLSLSIKLSTYKNKQHVSQHVGTLSIGQFC